MSKPLWLKRMLPANFYGRALLIMLVPIVVLQLLMAHIFYDRHWDSIMRNMAMNTASDVAVILREYRYVSDIDSPSAAQDRAWRIGQQLGIEVKFVGGTVGPHRTKHRYRDFMRALALRIHDPLTIDPCGDEQVCVAIQLAPNQELGLSFDHKRLVSDTTYIFVGWMIGSSLLLVVIAGLFLRNQVRPIVLLARAAEQFGLGQDVQNFTPRGASEVRRAGRAFLTMADRIRRQVQSRTEMLAGISHDLRTPLTRMKLEIEMGKLDAATRESLNADIDEMRRMIDEYLDFTRGDAGEPVEPVDIVQLVNNLCQQYRRTGEAVSCKAHLNQTVLMLRPHALRRALSNLIENALRYGGGRAEVTLEQSIAYLRIRVVDQGPGIPEGDQETVFKPFTRLEPSRNTATGGVGLGLSIARDIAQSHGGDVTLENQRDAEGNVTGLEVTLRLPRETQPTA